MALKELIKFIIIIIINIHFTLHCDFICLQALFTAMAVLLGWKFGPTSGEAPGGQASPDIARNGPLWSGYHDDRSHRVAHYKGTPMLGTRLPSTEANVPYIGGRTGSDVDREAHFTQL